MRLRSRESSKSLEGGKSKGHSLLFRPQRSQPNRLGFSLSWCTLGLLVSRVEVACSTTKHVVIFTSDKGQLCLSPLWGQDVIL